MFDSVLRAVTVIDGGQAHRVDLGVSEGRVAAWGLPGTLQTTRQLIDADGLTAIPGLVDAHVHLREPGIVHKEGFLTGTLAAAAGGVTTVMVMPTDDPVTMTPEQFDDKLRLAQAQCHVDFALQVAAGADVAVLRELLARGAVSIEVFLADVPESFLVRDAERLLAILALAAEVGAVVGVTPGDHDVVSARTQRMRASATGARTEFPPCRPPVSEALGIARACVAAIETGAAVHIRQLSTASGLAVFLRLRGLGRLTAEVTPHNLTLDEDFYLRHGPIAKVAPPLRPRADVDAVLKALGDGAIDMVATDHAPHLPAEKSAGEVDIWKAPGGLPGLQTFLPVMLSLVERGALSLADLVHRCAAAPAQVFGLSTKGRLAPGHDADLVLLDFSRRWTVADQDQLSKAGQTPFHGLNAAGAATSVWLRGREIVRDGKPCAPAGGRFCRPAR
jgi:dihydroorotase